MHHHLEHPTTKKEKKKAQQKKNLFHQQFFDFIRMRSREKKRVEDLKKELNKKPEVKKKEPEVWSSKVAKIRSRIDNTKRDADSRWQGFAATSDGTGRGR